ncbi:MAG TPA: ribosome maturation factor RimM [Pyrinomonadaceae bacterium]|nr:16S rRNA processing protein RimM [Chloracidobacterium sp.]MBP9934241.1 16S rRNA processing protein RimM [Pyrinomonadaceae bacterium]MBK7801563.1 16S rRNA processing protein RimM [Chloracidobacterium sp.]MBK9436879.1 16S rRNA processing protein RimM [Chloracidobacterium sp.]MBL0241872.1 16S rRNA processing protein RimM [Chloracidobacterium sp.]
MEELVTIAKIVKTRGLKGELVADLLTDFPQRFEGLESVTAVRPDGSMLSLNLDDFWFQNGRVILRFAGYGTIELAEALRGVEICVSEAEAVTLDDGEFYDWQLQGCRVETLDRTEIGVVTELMRNGATEILVVKGVEKDHLIPFAETICPEVDIENKLIRIDPPDGLLEF